MRSVDLAIYCPIAQKLDDLTRNKRQLIHLALYVTTTVTNKFKRYLYPQCRNVLNQMQTICFTYSLRVGGGTIFKVGGTSARQKD